MSEIKSKLHKMIDSFPEHKLVYIFRIVSDLKKFLDEDEEMDALLSLQADEALKRNDFISLDEAMKDMGFTIH